MRKPVPLKTQTNVLVKSRRRCCICYGLHRDHGIKQGQVAHIDRNSSNSEESNLAFLCLSHHDEYDSTTRQSKGLSPDEIRIYLDELYSHNNSLFTFVRGSTSQYNFDLNWDPSDIEGSYVRTSEDDSAEIRVVAVGQNMYHVSGIAFHGTNRTEGPNIGQIDFVSHFREDSLLFLNQDNSVVMKFGTGTLAVSESNWFGKYGVGVNFNGKYTRTSVSSVTNP